MTRTSTSASCPIEPPQASAATRADAWRLAAFVLLPPLAWAPGLSFHFDAAPKAVALLLLAAWVLLEPRTPARLAALWARPAGRLFLGLCAAYAVVLLIATATAENPWLALAGTGWRRLGTFTQLAALLCAADAAVTLSTHRRLAHRAIAAAGALSGAYALAQSMGLDPFLNPALYTFRPPATFGHAAYLGSFLLTAGFLSAAAFTLETSRPWRALCAASAAVSLAGIAVCGTRAVWVGLLAGACLPLVYRRRLPRPRVLLIASAAAAALLVVLRLSPAWNAIAARAAQFPTDLAGGTRLPLWHDTLALIAAHPLTGTGPESFSVAFPAFQSLELSRLYPAFYHESPHSAWLDAAAAAGLPGLLTLVALCAAGFYWARRDGRRPLAAAAALAALAVTHSFFVLTIPSFCALLLLLALLLPEGSAPAPPPALLRALAPAAAIIFVLAAVPLAWSDFCFARIQAALEAHDTPQAIRWYARASQIPRRYPAPDLWYAQRVTALSAEAPPNRAELWEQAVTAAGRSLEAPGEDAILAQYNAAVLAVMAQDPARAEAGLRAAIARAPNWYQPRWLLCRVLRQTGRTAEAAAQCAAALDQIGPNHPELRRQIEAAP